MSKYLTDDEVLGPQGRTSYLTDEEVFGVADVAAPIPERPQRSAARGAADLALEVVSGGIKGVKFISDAAGADNIVSRGLRAADDAVKGLQSPLAQYEDRQVSQIMREAEDKGVAEQVGQALRAAGVAPVRMSVGALATGAPVIAASMIPGVREASWGARLATMGTLGATQGAGVVKSSIYEGVRDRALEDDFAPSEAQAAAEQAQRYSQNPGLIAGGAVLGAAASATGFERSVAQLLGRKAAEQAVARGAVGSVAKGIVKEAPLEATQGGQEKYAANVATDRAGFETPAFRGVVGSATLEGVLSAPGGVVGGALDYAGGRRAPALGEQPPATGQPPAAEQPQIRPTLSADTIQATAQARLDTLERKANGTPEQTVVDDAGNPVTVPGEQPQYLNLDERRERKFLRENLGQPQALADGFGVAIGAAATPEARLAELDLLSQVRGLTEPEQAEFDGLLSQFDQEDADGGDGAVPPVDPGAAGGGAADAAPGVDAGVGLGDGTEPEVVGPGAAAGPAGEAAPPGRDGQPAAVEPTATAAPPTATAAASTPTEVPGTATAVQPAATAVPDALAPQPAPITREAKLPLGSTVYDGQGNGWRVQNRRSGILTLQPIVNGEPDTTAAQRFVIDPDKAPADSGARVEPLFLQAPRAGGQSAKAEAAPAPAAQVEQGMAPAAAQPATPPGTTAATPPQPQPAASAAAPADAPQAPQQSAREFLRAIGKAGGIDIGLQSDIVGERAGRGSKGRGNVMLPGAGGTLFRRNGQQLDEIARRMVEAGYLTQADIDSDLDNGGVNKLTEMIGAALRGQAVPRLTTAEAQMEAGARARIDDDLRAYAERMGVRTEGMTPEQIAEALPKAEQEFANSEARAIADEITVEVMAQFDLPGEAMDDSQLIAQAESANPGSVERAAMQYDDATDFLRALQGIVDDARASQADRGRQRNLPPPDRQTGQPGGGSQGAPRSPPGEQEEARAADFALTAPTPQEVIQRQQAAERAQREKEAADRAADQAERERKDREDIRLRSEAAAGTFELGQDAMANLSGQQDIFAAPAEAAAPVATENTSPEPVAETAKREQVAAPIGDFGEKIGGARKDTWTSFKDRMQQAEGLDVTTEPLSKTWPVPDYQALLDGGSDPWAVAFMHAVRDEVPAKPKRAWKLKAWAAQVKMLRDLGMGALDGRMDAAQVRAKLGEAAKTSRGMADVADRAALYELVGHGKSLAGVRVSRHEYSLHNGVEFKPPKIVWTVEKDAAATAFSNWPRELASGVTREEAIANFKAKYAELEISPPASKEATFDIYSRRGENGYWIGKKIGRNPAFLAGPFATIKEARAYKDANNAELVEKLAKFKDTPRERRDTNEPRVGEDMRGGQDVTPAMFTEAFGFRGVEFGNWVEQKRRQKDLNEAYDALMDMAAVLGVKPKALSLNGELGLAFGARGSGGKDAAAAHYEPTKIVINLTKKEGAGSLGHEWWHALDNYFSRMRGKGDGMMTESLDVSLASKGSEFAHRGEVRKEMVEAFGEVMKAIRATGIKARSAKLDAKRTKEYWTTQDEMSARAFESYLISKLQDQGASNDYLANVVDEKSWAALEALGFELEGSYPYPQAPEVPTIRAAFDHFFQTVETRETDNGIMFYEPSQAYTVEQKKRDDRQLDLFLDRGPVESQAGPAGERAQREAVEAVRDLRSTESLLGLALSRDFAARQRASLVGQRVASTDDLAVLAQVYRDPRFETLRVFFADANDRVIAQVGVTQRLPAAAMSIMGDDAAAYFKAMTDAAKAKGAKKFFMLHNHPSGIAEPSQADLLMTRTWADTVDIPFGGHVIIDTNEYAVIDGKGTGRRITKDFGQPKPYGPGEFNGTIISSPDKLMSISKRLEVDDDAVTLITTNYQNIVTGITTVPASSLQGPAGRVRMFLHRAALKTSGSRIFAVSRSLTPLQYVEGLVTDSIYVRDDGTHKSVADMGGRVGDLYDGFNRRARLSPDTSAELRFLRQFGEGAGRDDVAEPAARYETPEFRRWFRDSKVVDENGRPLVVYHGTNEPTDFAAFRTGDRGAWFSADPDFTIDYATRFGEEENARTIPAYLSVQKPLRIPRDVDLSDDVYLDEALEAINAANGTSFDASIFGRRDGAVDLGYEFFAEPEFIRAVKAAGFDGMLAYENATPTWNVFEPTQVKSPFNAGAFDPGNPDIRASRGGAAGLPATNVTRIADAIRRTWTNGPEVVVAADMQDPAVPQAVRDYDAQQRSKGATGEPEGFFYGGKVYLVASQLATPSDVLRVLSHESLGHYGLRGLFGSRLAGVLDQIALVRRTEVMAKLKEYGLPDTPAGRRVAAEEVLAVMAQTQPQLGFVRRAVAAIRTWLRGAGLNLRMTDDEIIRTFIIPARQWVMRGGERQVAPGEVSMSRSQPVHAEIDEQTQDLLEDFGLPVESREDAKRALAAGDRVFVASEMDEQPLEVLSARGLDGYTPDQMLVLRRGDGVAFSRQPNDDAFANEVLAELAQHDELFRYPVSRRASLDGVMAEVFPRATYLGEDTRTDERQESGADVRHVFQTPEGKNLYVFERGKDVWIDVSRLEEGERGSGFYAAVMNYAHNAGMRFIGDPAGLSEAAVVRRTSAMLSSALRFGTTRHLDAAPEQIAGDPENGIQPLRWQGDDLAKTTALIETFLGTLYTQFPGLREYRYDFRGNRFIDSRGRPLDAARLERGEGSPAGRQSRAGQATLRRGIFLQSLVEIEGRARPELLENVLTRGRALVRGGGLGAMFSRTQPAGDREPRFSRNTLGNGAPQTLPPSNRWQRLKARAMELTSPQALDKLIYELQDKFIDLKRIRDHIAALGGTVNDLNDAYLGEELYHKRLAKRTQDFLADEVKPLLAELRATGTSISDFERFLHARHAPEANRVLADRNPNQEMIDAKRAQLAADVRQLELDLQRAKARGTATKSIEQALDAAREQQRVWGRAQAFRGTEAERTSLSGMSDAEAQALVNGLPPGRRQVLDGLAARVDAINAKTLDALQSYGLMDRASLDAWRSTYQHYVPLHRDEANADSVAHPIGQGYSSKGDAAKRRTGSTEKVTNILGHVVMQREAALTRGEKARVGKQLYLLAAQNPDPSLWQVDKPPKIRRVDEATGTVVTMVDPLYKNQPNVLMVRIGGKDASIAFNERNPQAMRLAESLRNLDVGDLHFLVGVVSKGTRWFASINTQYNPIFGLINFTRDLGAGVLNLSTTPLAGKGRQIARDTFPAMRAIYRDTRGKTPADKQWAQLWQQMQDDGGTTGYRDLFVDADERAKKLQRELASLDRGQAGRAAHATLDWLSAYNETMENAVRLAAYKEALDMGMSRPRAASLAKNLTVNFNRKGKQTRELGAFYAFFNAAVQGNTRMFQTLLGPAGKKIMLGGVMLGAVNTLIGMAVMGGGDEDEWEKIPEFIKERSIVLPIGRQDYVTIPLPLGFHVLPNIGRTAVEMMLGDPDKTPGKMVGKLLMTTIEAFNPLGSSQDLAQMVFPTVLDPAVALMQNRDWTGRPIYRPDYNSLDPTPGPQRAKDTASTPSRVIAELLNLATGGTEYRPGAISWTPDQIDYVFGQLTGGIGRELLKLNQTIAAPFTGEELPAYKIPLAGRIYGNTRGPSAQSERFYENVRELNEIENELRGRAKAGKDVQEVLREEPLARLIGTGNAAEQQIRRLREYRRAVSERAEPGYRSEVAEINERIGGVMSVLNRQVREAKRAEVVE